MLQIVRPRLASGDKSARSGAGAPGDSTARPCPNFSSAWSVPGVDEVAPRARVTTPASPIHGGWNPSGRSDYQNVTTRRAHDRLGDAADEEAIKPGVTACTEHDEIASAPGGGVHDDLPRIPPLDHGVPFDPGAREGPEEVLQLRPRLSRS